MPRGGNYAPDVYSILRTTLLASLSLTSAIGLVPATAQAQTPIVPPVAPPQVARRPTPHEGITRALAPLEAALADLHATDNERAALTDVLAQGETWAAQIVEADQRGTHDVVQVLTHAIDLLARVARGRIEATRVEAAAADAERAEVTAEARRVQARAAVERVTERRIALDRVGGVDPHALPPPEPEGLHAAPPTTLPAGSHPAEAPGSHAGATP